jgi:hypothetical protein
MLTAEVPDAFDLEGIIQVVSPGASSGALR